jgi:hypothetical protein
LEFILPELIPFGTASLEKEWAFLCACVSPLASLERMRTLLAGELNWEVLLEMVDQHGVQGILASRFEEAGFVGVPVQAREKLQSRMRAQHLFTLSLTAELFRILQDFSRANLQTVVVKGPVVSLLAHGDPAMRNFSDLDLLVQHRDIQGATHCMLALGFEPDVPDVAIGAGKIPGEFVFRRPGTRCIVELHTERTFRHCPRPMRLQELLDRKRTLLLDGREVPALSLEDELVLDCIHGAKDFWERLMWISDVAALVARHAELDWIKARTAAADVGAERMLRVGILLGTLVFELQLPSAIAPDIERDRTCLDLCREIATWLPYAGLAPPSLQRRAVFRMKMAGGGLTGAAYLMRLSLSPTEEDWEEGAEERRSWVWDALRRPFRLLRKYGSGK